MLYRVLIDYADGYTLDPDTFNTVEEAVRYALDNTNGENFLIIQIVAWKAVRANDEGFDSHG